VGGRLKAGALAVAVLTASGCGGSNGGTSSPTAVIQVAGGYDIRKTIAEDTCGLSHPGDVITNPGTVAQAAGATDFVLNDHGTRDLPGTLHADGTFDLRPSSSLVMGAIAATDTFAGGRFTVSGFTVRVTTALQASPREGAPPGPCHVVTDWAGTKQGAPNVIP